MCSNYLVEGAAYHLVEGVHRREEGGVVIMREGCRILARRAAFRNAMRRSYVYIVYASSTIRAMHSTEVWQAPGRLRCWH
jgi:hypothetical protein